MGRKLKTIYQFIDKANLIHNFTYDYSLTYYINDKTKIDIVCVKHGIFKQMPNNHLRGNGCPVCYGNKNLSTKEFIEKSKKIHGNKYDYSLVEYKSNKFNVKIVCPEHGVFEQQPNSHLNNNGCAICSRYEKNK